MSALIEFVDFLGVFDCQGQFVDFLLIVEMAKIIQVIIICLVVLPGCLLVMNP